MSHARRAWMLCSAFAVVLGLAVWGCLNPRPDDFPNAGQATTIEPPEPPSDEEFCNDDPLAADCDDGGGNMIDPSGGAPSDIETNNPDESDDEPGADGGAADAGAPDAGPSANE